MFARNKIVSKLNASMNSEKRILEQSLVNLLKEPVLTKNKKNCNIYFRYVDDIKEFCYKKKKVVLKILFKR